VLNVFDISVMSHVIEKAVLTWLGDGLSMHGSCQVVQYDNFII